MHHETIDDAEINQTKIGKDNRCCCGDSIGHTSITPSSAQSTNKEEMNTKCIADMDTNLADRKRKASVSMDSMFNTSEDRNDWRMPTLRELIPPASHHRKGKGLKRKLVTQNAKQDNCITSFHPPDNDQVATKNDNNGGSDEGTTNSNNNAITQTNKNDEIIQVDWSAVIERARTHPHEAKEFYFGSDASSATADFDSSVINTKLPCEDKSIPPATPLGDVTDTNQEKEDEGVLANDNNNNANFTSPKIATYKPLHAMLKYDPPLPAVEAVLRAYPPAALDVTFEGTALKIAAESKVSSMMVLRLLLVAEMAMRKKKVMAAHQQQHRHHAHQMEMKKSNQLLSQQIEKYKSDVEIEEGTHNSENENDGENTQPHDVIIATDDGDYRESMGESNTSSIFFGQNPIRWICEPRIPVKIAALLLKWYPVGAFQRQWDSVGAPVDDLGAYVGDENGDIDVDGASSSFYESESPLIEIVDDFARDHDKADDDPNEDQEENDDDDLDFYDSDSDDDCEDPSNPKQKTTSMRREQSRKERRWEKFLHILHATDKALLLAKSNALIATTEKHNYASMPKQISSDVVTVTSAASAIAPSAKTDSSTAKVKISPPPSPFRPVHAWIRCLTHPHLGLEHCRPYGVWSVLRVMGQRIPSEFTTRDESDGNRTAFQTLAESPAKDCRLCLEEVRDVVECLMDADYRSAFLPRKIDGRLIGHVALENGWPCRDLFSRKASATCA